MALLEQIEAKNSFIELCGFLAQANHAPKKVARFTASAAALLGRHCRKKVRNCVKTLEITASFFKVCNLTQQLSPPKSSARGHSQNNSNQFTFSHFLFYYYFVHLIFGHFWRRSYENTKILRNLCLHFARQDGQDVQDGKKRKENHTTKVTKIPKTKRRKYGMNET